MSTSGSRTTPTLTTAVKAQKAQVILSEEGGVTFGLHQTPQFSNAMVPLCWHRYPHTKYMVLIWGLVMTSLLVSQLVWSCVVLSFVHCFLAQSLPWTLYIMNSWIIINPFLLKLVHCLVGVNSDGHSTLANYWQNRDQNPGLCASTSVWQRLFLCCVLQRRMSWKSHALFWEHTHERKCLPSIPIY